MSEKLKFYCAEFCPFAHRAWIAVEEKKVPYKYIEVNYFHVQSPTTQEFYKVSKPKTVPAFDHEGKHVYESFESVIYLDEAFPNSGVKLVPKDPYLSWKMKVLFKGVVSDVVKPFYQLLMNQDKEQQENLKNAFIEKLKAVDKVLEESEGDYLVGKDYSAADICLYPFIERTEVLLTHYSGLVVPWDQLKNLKKWKDVLESRDAIKNTRRDRTKESKQRQWYSGDKRAQYLQSFYKIYALNKVGVVRKQQAQLAPNDSPQISDEQLEKLLA